MFSQMPPLQPDTLCISRDVFVFVFFSFSLQKKRKKKKSGQVNFCSLFFGEKCNSVIIGDLILSLENNVLEALGGKTTLLQVLADKQAGVFLKGQESANYISHTLFIIEAHQAFVLA